MKTRIRGLSLFVGSLLVFVGAGCSGDDDDGGGGSLTVAAVSSPSTTVGPGERTVPVVEVSSTAGEPRANVDVVFDVARGGGSLGGGDSARSVVVVTDADGRASVQWDAGIAPVVNRLIARVAGASVDFDTRVVLDAPLDTEEFGDIPGFLRESGYSVTDMDGAEVFLASTEDLAFVSDDQVLLGLSAGSTAVEGALIAMDASGAASLVALEGDPLVGTLGVAIDRDGVLWVADPRGEDVGALLRISTDGVVETVITSAGDQNLIGPNYVAIGPDGDVYISDPCLGIVLRYDPTTDTIDSVLTMDVVTQGGPNGLAFDASGENLYFATESIALLCARPDLPLTDPVAGLFRVGVDGSDFGTVEPIAERRGLFGDGLGFDVEGNLYVIFDTESGFMLEESAVWVLPEGETELVKFLANGDRVYANLAWGRGDFGDETLYIALLAVDAFGLPVRGIDRIDLGIAGLPLLP